LRKLHLAEVFSNPLPVLYKVGNIPNLSPPYRPKVRDANHRYIKDKADLAVMVARGWLAEGDGPDLVVMCAPV